MSIRGLVAVRLAMASSPEVPQTVKGFVKTLQEVLV